MFDPLNYNYITAMDNNVSEKPSCMMGQEFCDFIGKLQG